jgi:hypothetical protein
MAIYTAKVLSLKKEHNNIWYIRQA